MSPARRRRQLLAFVCLGALGVGVAACGAKGQAAEDVTADIRASQASASKLTGTWPIPTTTTTTTAPPSLDPATGLSISGPMGPPWPTTFTAADALVPSVALYSAPGVRVPTNRSLPNPTVEGVPLVFLVRKRQTVHDVQWLQVQINERPNGATAWIKSSDVRTRSVLYHLLIELGARRLTVFHGDQVVWSTSVAPGKPSSPTPTGAFYVDIRTKTGNPGGAYGPYQISFTGFSTVYEHFGSGNGQVAMHGTNDPNLIGTYASHGCVRMNNADITHLLGLAIQGSPVIVVS